MKHFSTLAVESQIRELRTRVAKLGLEDITELKKDIESLAKSSVSALAIDELLKGLTILEDDYGI
jgi:hypothetical protein